MIKKLWQKDNQTSFNKTVEIFETGDDIALDQVLVPYDVAGTLAHGQMLVTIGILKDKEFKILKKALKEILVLYKKGQFQIEMGDEDVHTKIENYLTKTCGLLGKKIHTGRSRNDQVLTALRLYEKDKTNMIYNDIETLVKEFKSFSQKYKSIAMPGYTHMQKAMPATLGMWIGSFRAALEDDLKMLFSALELIDQSPLGSAAGFGSTLPMDCQLTAKILGFAKVQENPMYVQASRGKFEANILAALISVLMTLNKLASDVMLFTTSEFGFFQADPSVCTGSSLMPQKKNVDLAELIRSKVHVVLGNYASIVSLSSNLISGYNRDIQDGKKPLIESLKITHETLQAAGLLVGSIKPDRKKLNQAMTEELFATEKALELVKKGWAFRDAYKVIAKKTERHRRV